MSFALDYPELEKLYARAGGKFRLTVLLQRRVNELVKGAPKLIKVDQKHEKDYVFIAVEEFKNNKINLSEDDQHVVHAED
ncbi:MAG: DNA-directed RNA polymerase subunit omega [Planctomycetes bacterium]|jgi:DNA-directed RNA polymerase subunit K/omega|nr:DNA-directed RNA polymerase subunit omega [Planctomycetota bacterium]MCL4730855.1 DNA-directed RNA polymerase subunit omega [Planctomycetota bacterium]